MVTNADAGSTSPDGGSPDAGLTSPDAGSKPEWQTVRVALHLHSAVSHDACDGHSRDGGALASLDQTCLAELKDALCASRIDVALLTDHPRYMDARPFDEALLYQPERGETLLDPTSDGATGVRLPCPNGADALLAAGFEGTHTMPLGLHHHLGAADYGTPTDSTTAPADAESLLSSVHAAQGIYFTAHSEGPDLPAALLETVPTDGMEWYNVHGNFLALFSGDVIGQATDLAHIADLIDALRGLEPFLAGSPDAQPDLVYLSLLEAGFPEAGLEKWYEVLGHRFIAGGLGNDVHQNVSVKPLCQGAAAQAICAAVAGAYPNLLTALAAGGTLQLSDGERIDSYARVLRWLNNRVLVTERSIPAVVSALAAGRSYGVFAVLGEPGPVAFWAERGGERFEMGASLPSAGTVLRARLPDRPAPELGASWTSDDAALAELDAILWRTGPTGKEPVATYTEFGASVALPSLSAGAYSLEIRLTPKHLRSALGSAHGLAENEYRWVLTNAIEITE
jgi:hypothetical protein